MAFKEPLDIANRALQHLGKNRIATLDDMSEEAREIRACYDAVRLSEMQRNTWRFATRSARLRPIDADTLAFTPSVWSTTTTYTAGQIASYASTDGNTYWWQLYSPTSLGEQPDISPKWQHYFGPITLDLFSSTDQGYDTGELVKGSNGSVYLSLVNVNTADPTTAAAGKWALLAGTTEAVFVPWPAGVGPVSDQSTRNLYRLPFGYLREAPLVPKAGINTYLGLTDGQPRLDWTYEGDYFYTASSKPLVMRFVADVWDVTKFAPMFCEMLAARIAKEAAPKLAEPKEMRTTLANVATHYSSEAMEARTRNAIEVGPVFPPVDAYIACRI